MACISRNYCLYLLQQCGGCCDVITYDDVIVQQSKQLSIVMESFVQSLAFSVKTKDGRAANEIHDRLCAMYGDSLTAQLPDGQMSFSIDMSCSKMTRGPAGRLTLLICL